MSLVGLNGGYAGRTLELPRGVAELLLASVVAAALGLAVAVVVQLPLRLALPTLLLLITPFALLAIGEVRRPLLALLLIDLPLQLDVHLRYQDGFAAEYGGIVGLNLSATTFALIGLYAHWAFTSEVRERRRARINVRGSLAPALYVLTLVLSLIVAGDLELAVFEIFLLGQMLLLFIYVSSTVRTRSDVVFVCLVLFGGLALEGALMISERFTGWAGPRELLIGAGATAEASRSADELNRVSGTIGGVNPAGTYLSLLLAPAVSLLIMPVHRWVKLVALAAFALGSLALVFTLSRGGWLTYGVSMTMFLVLAWHRRWLHPAAPLSALAVVTIFILAFQDSIIGRILADDNRSAAGRVPLMMLAFRMISDHPILGVGANNFSTAMQPYVTPDFAVRGGEWLSTVHNKYLLTWAETGLLGLLAFVGFLVVTLRRAWNVWQRHDRFLSPLALALGAALVGHCIHLFVDIFNSRAQVQTLWLCAALIAALTSIKSPKRRAQYAPTGSIARLDQAAAWGRRGR